MSVPNTLKRWHRNNHQEQNRNTNQAKLHQRITMALTRNTVIAILLIPKADHHIDINTADR